MKKHRVAGVLLALLCCLALVGVVLAQTSAHYGLTWSVIAGGGGTSQSAHYVLSGSNGQWVAGGSASNQYKVGSGFWATYGVPPPPPSFKIHMPLIVSGYSGQ